MNTSVTVKNKDRIDQILLNAHRTVSGHYVASVPLDLIQIDYSYQRHIRGNHLTSVFDLNKCSLIILNRRSNEPDVLYAADGSHRIKAAMANGYSELEAEIFVDLTREQEARWFANQATYIKKISTTEEYKANLVWGETIDTSIEKLAKKYKLKVINAGDDDRVLSGLTTARSIVKNDGIRALEDILKLIKKCKWDVFKLPYTAKWLNAFRYAYHNNNGFNAKVQENFTKIFHYESPYNIGGFSHVKHPTYDHRKALNAVFDEIAKGEITLADVQAIAMD